MRYRFVPPSRADGTLAPAAFVAALAMMALAQFLLTDAVELPAVGPVGAGAPVAPVADPGTRGIPQTIMQRPIFAPSATAAGGEDGDTGPDPLGGVAIAGSVGVGRMRYVVVQEPGAALRRVGVGGTIAGWRLVGITDEAALLARGGERLRRPFGGKAGDGESQDKPEDQTEFSDDGGPM